MTARLSIILIIFLPIILFGQSKDCGTYYKPPPSIHCYLKAYKKSNDTLLTIMPKECNTVHFDSIVNGQLKIYSTDSILLMEIVGIRNGTRHGADIIFHRNGLIESKAIYKKGKLNGKFVSYFETGKINRIGYFKNNKFTGTEMQYWDNGKISCQVMWKNNYRQIFSDDKYWDKNGNIIGRQEYIKLWYECN